MAVVKADAYGHGLGPVARALDGEVAFFGVANVTEAETLRTAGVEAPLFLLGPALPEERPRVLACGGTPAISGVKEALAYSKLTTAEGKTIPVHLAVDTGMGRAGVLEDTALETASKIQEMPGVALEGITSHLPSADEDANFSRAQADRFCEIVRSLGTAPRWVHLANSAGILTFDQTGLTLARPGIALYGISPLPSEQTKFRPVLSLHTRVILVRELPAGQGVSYGRTFITDRPTLVATLAIGYGDGYPRALSNSGTEVLIRGRRCPVLGRVTMDAIMIDVTALGDTVNAGDQATLIGRQGNEEILATELAEKAGTIPWEIFTGITPRARRLYHGTD